MWGVDHVRNIYGRARQTAEYVRLIFTGASAAQGALVDIARDDGFWEDWDSLRTQEAPFEVGDGNDEFLNAELLEYETRILMQHGVPADLAGTFAAMMLATVRTPVRATELPSSDEVRAALRTMSNRLRDFDSSTIDRAMLVADVAFVLGGVALMSVDAARVYGTGGVDLGAYKSVLGGARVVKTGVQRHLPRG